MDRLIVAPIFLKLKENGRSFHARYLISLTMVALACSAQTGALKDAEKELFAARYKSAAELYAKIVETDPSESSAYYGLVRSLLEDHRSHEAYKVAAEALQKSPQAPSVQTAAGLAAYRSGDLAKAEEYFHAALRLDPGYPGALQGLASIHRIISRFKTARDLQLAAYRKSPGDPELMIAYANTLKGAKHIAALQEVLASLDPDSEEARRVAAHIANDLAVGDRKLSRLTSPYEKNKIKLYLIRDSPAKVRGVGLQVQFNQHQNVRMMLDTGASGISVSPKIAERAGLEILGDKSTDTKGIGDARPQASYRYIASQVRIGDTAFADYPISVFRAAQSADFDGLIGADVFRAFIVTLDFPKLELWLDPRPDGPHPASDQPADAGSAPGAGFQRVFRFGDHLVIPTFINKGRSSLFLIDSGSSANMIDTAIARESSGLYSDGRTTVTGVQGKVNDIHRADRVSLTFAGFRQENPSLIAISLEKMSDSMGVAFGGILGMPVLSQLAFTIDYQEGTVRFEHGR